MANELRKLIGRNLRYTQMNEQIDLAMKQLQGNTSPEAQMQLNALQQQRQNIDNLMAQPMTEQEYAQYDDNGHYVGNNLQPQNTSGVGQAIADGINHAAQGVSLGWSDEAFGSVGGTGQVIANGIWRATGNSTNGEGFKEAWNKGYQEYRDYARQELQDGYQRNPAISAGAEVVGAVASPIKPFKTKGYFDKSWGKFVAHPEDIAQARWLNTVGTGVINGVGYTNQNTPEEYAKNIGISMIASAIGTATGNRLFGGGNDMYRFGRGTVNAVTQSIPYGHDYFRKKDDDEEY